MRKSVSLKELPDTYIASGMSLSELSEYLSVSIEIVKQWEKFFNLSPKIETGSEKIYSKSQIDNFIKIKEMADKGKSLKEIKEKLFNFTFEVITNPYEVSKKVSEFNPAKNELIIPYASEFAIRPFLTQLNKANHRIEGLLEEKAKIVEDTAIEKADLLAKINVLKNKNVELLAEKENITMLIAKKEQQIRKALSREETLSKTLHISQEILNKKENEITSLNQKIEGYEKVIKEKNALIYNLDLEINQLLEAQNAKKWWQFWK
ncbi:MAG TPA: MerR family transcriptional regulator [Candidatus Gastranaerophilales bacterium]|nr:MerR family transcriptional regulator [Candidatus Gastranaerophilales bacterium]